MQEVTTMHINDFLATTNSLFNMATAIAMAFYEVVEGPREMGNGI